MRIIARKVSANVNAKKMPSFYSPYEDDDDHHHMVKMVHEHEPEPEPGGSQEESEQAAE